MKPILAALAALILASTFVACGGVEPVDPNAPGSGSGSGSGAADGAVTTPPDSTDDSSNSHYDGTSRGEPSGACPSALRQRQHCPAGCIYYTMTSGLKPCLQPCNVDADCAGKFPDVASPVCAPSTYGGGGYCTKPCETDDDCIFTHDTWLDAYCKDKRCVISAS